MPTAAISPTVRSILSANIDLSADEVIRKAKEKGVTAPEASIRSAVHNIRSELKRGGATKPAPAPAAARATKPPKPAAPKPVTLVPVPVPVPALASSTPELSSVLANVALVNTVAGVCGGIDSARQVAEAVRACGGVE